MASRIIRRCLAGINHLSPEQAAKVRDAFGPATGYLWRPVDRLVKVGLDVRDPKLTQLATAARDAMHGLGVELHYQSCGQGVGRLPTAT
jgi:hypothetical protein